MCVLHSHIIRVYRQANAAARVKILQSFSHSMHGATATQLEEALANAASLFLTRLSAWLRLTYAM